MTDGQHLPDQTEDFDALEPKESRLTTAHAALGIAIALILGLLWLFNVSATASQGLQLSQQNQQQLQNKADREDLKEMKQDIKEIRDYLLNGKVPK